MKLLVLTCAAWELGSAFSAFANTRWKWCVVARQLNWSTIRVGKQLRLQHQVPCLKLEYRWQRDLIGANTALNHPVVWSSAASVI